MPMHDRILGRSDDMFIFRAVNIYPSHVDQIISNIRGLGSEYQIILNRDNSGKDQMIIKVECMAGAPQSESTILKKSVEEEIKKQLLVSCDTEVCYYGELPRSERKTKRVFDNRE
jgi:phenylacetate-CoA ligase